MKKRYSFLFACFLILIGLGVQAQTYHLLSGGPFTQDWSNTGLITTPNVWSGVPSVQGYGGNDLVTLSAVDPQTILAPGFTTPLNVAANQTNPNTYTSGGLAEFEITNPVVAFQGSGTSDAPFLVVFLNSTGVTNVTVQYTLRDVDGSADNSIQPVALQYRTDGTSNFVNVPAAFVADASIGPSLTQSMSMSVTLPAACDNQGQLQIRFITSNAAGNDEWIGIDDILINGTTGGTDQTPPGVSTVSVLSTTSLTVAFTEAVSAATAQNTTNYSGLGTVSSAVLDGAGTLVTLTLADPIALGVSHSLTVTGVADLAGNVMTTPFVHSFVFNNSVGQLVITEIYYNDPSLVSTNDSLEFIELYNAGVDPIQLGGYSFSSGITYTFPAGILGPGQYLVLTRYPGVAEPFFGITSQGWTSGSLSNSGATIQIVNTVGTVIDVVPYDDADPWPLSPDGNGPSLVLCDPSSDNSLAANWTAATVTNFGPFGGVDVIASPGSTNCPPVIDPVLAFDPATYQVSETDGSVTVTVTFTNASLNSTSVDVSLGSGTATLGSDFSFSPVTLTFPANTTTAQTIVLGVINDSDYETNETIILQLSNPTNNAVIAVGMATITLTSDDPMPIVNDLFFSEYVEGLGGNNKVLEIYNPTNAAIDLSLYQVRLGSNGSAWGNTLAPVGLLDPGDVFVIANDQSTASILALADTTSSVTFFNGDDALGLFKDGILIDVIGVQGVDPGTSWSVAGVATGTADHTLVRKLSVTHGNTDWASAAGTTPENSEWIVYEANNFSYVGWHGNQNTPPSISSITPDPIMPIPSTPVNISASISDDVSVASANLAWGLATGSLTTTIPMVQGTGTTWTTSATIPVQPAGTTVYYRVSATDNVAASSQSAELSYVVAPEPVVVTIEQIQTPTDLVTNDSPYNNLTVTTSGIVTGVNATGYFLQSGTGIYKGVYVYHPGNTVARGDNLTITGLVTEYFNLTEIKNIISTVTNSTGNPLPAPSLLNGAMLDEKYEGVLVRFNNFTCTNAALGSGEWEISDANGAIRVDDYFYPYTPVLAQAYQVTGPVYFSFTAFKVEPRDVADIVPAQTQNLNLNTGWNLISTYMAPFNTLIANVLSPVSSNVRIVKNVNGQIYWPAFNVNTIVNMVVGQGYQVNMFTSSTLTIVGTQIVPETTPLNLNTGWNMIGYLRTSSAPIATMLSPIVSHIVIVKNGTGQVYWPLFNINSIVNMNPGFGYQINVNAAQVLTYPANTTILDKARCENLQPVHFGLPHISGQNLVAGFPAEVLQGLAQAGDELAVVNARGQVCGVSTVDGGSLAVTVWGDDEFTAEQDGLQANERFSLVLWNHVTGIETPLDVRWIRGESAFTANDLKVAALLSPAASMGFEVFPNPTTASCTLEFNLSQDGPVQVDLYDLSGKVLGRLARVDAKEGANALTLDLQNLPAGKYILRAEGSGLNSQTLLQIVH